MTDKEFFEVSYDLPSENQLCLQPQKGDTQEVAGLRAAARKQLAHLRFGFASRLECLGRYITNSVFVVPPEFKQQVDSLISRYRTNYSQVRNQFSQPHEIPTVKGCGFSATPQIVVLGYKGQYGDYIQSKAVTVIKSHLDKLLDDYDGRILKASEKGKVNARSIAKVNKESRTIEDIAAGFGAAKEKGIENLLEQLATKVQILNNY